MDDFRSMAEDSRFRRTFEKLLHLATQRGDADLVAERLTWGIDPNCRTRSGRTPLIANIRGRCPSVEVVRILLQGGADASLTDNLGLSALDYARRKLLRLQSKPRRQPRKSPSLDENDQLQLSPEEQAEWDKMREELPGTDREFFHIWWKERLRAARRVFNDVDQVEKIVSLLETT